MLTTIFTLLEYGLPMDEAELDRIDMCHVKYCALIGKNRYLAPISDPQKILDLGCGTGPSFPQSLAFVVLFSRWERHADDIKPQEFGRLKWLRSSPALR